MTQELRSAANTWVENSTQKTYCGTVIHSVLGQCGIHSEPAGVFMRLAYLRSSYSVPYSHSVIRTEPFCNFVNKSLTDTSAGFISPKEYGLTVKEGIPDISADSHHYLTCASSILGDNMPFDLARLPNMQTEITQALSPMTTAPTIDKADTVTTLNVFAKAKTVLILSFGHVKEKRFMVLEADPSAPTMTFRLPVVPVSKRSALSSKGFELIGRFKIHRDLSFLDNEVIITPAHVYNSAMVGPNVRFYEGETFLGSKLQFADDGGLNVQSASKSFIKREDGSTITVLSSKPKKLKITKE